VELYSRAFVRVLIPYVQSERRTRDSGSSYESQADIQSCSWTPRHARGKNEVPVLTYITVITYGTPMTVSCEDLRFANLEGSFSDGTIQFSRTRSTIFHNFSRLERRHHKKLFIKAKKKQFQTNSKVFATTESE